MTAFEEIAGAASRAAEGVGRSVVRVGGSWRGGSGFVVGEGLVLTNAHNVRGESVMVTFADGRQAEGSVRGSDADGDLAALAVDTADVPPVGWASDELGLGSAVFGVGLSRSGGVRVSVGFVSGLARPFRGPRGRRIAGAIEHSAPLPPGSSGSPLVDASGRVAGINTNRLGNGFYLALPAADPLAARIDALGRGEAIERPRLGIGLAPAFAARRMRRAVGLPERDGLLVRAVEDGSPAARAGISEGDLVVAAAGRAMTDVDDLYDVLGSLPAGEPLELSIVRGSEERSVSVSFGGGWAEGRGGSA